MHGRRCGLNSLESCAWLLILNAVLIGLVIKVNIELRDACGLYTVFRTPSKSGSSLLVLSSDTMHAPPAPTLGTFGEDLPESALLCRIATTQQRQAVRFQLHEKRHNLPTTATQNMSVPVRAEYQTYQGHRSQNPGSFEKAWKAKSAPRKRIRLNFPRGAILPLHGDLAWRTMLPPGSMKLGLWSLLISPGFPG